MLLLDHFNWKQVGMFSYSHDDYHGICEVIYNLFTAQADDGYHINSWVQGLDENLIGGKEGRTDMLEIMKTQARSKSYVQLKFPLAAVSLGVPF